MELKHSFIIHVKRSGTCSNCNVPYSWTETSVELIDFVDKNHKDRITIEALYKTFCKKCYNDKFRPLKEEDTYSDRYCDSCCDGRSEKSNCDSDDSEDSEDPDYLARYLIDTENAKKSWREYLAIKKEQGDRVEVKLIEERLKEIDAKTHHIMHMHQAIANVHKERFLNVQCLKVRVARRSRTI